MKENTERPVKIKKWFFNPVLIMLILFSIPYLLSWQMIITGDSPLFKQGVSKGELIIPVRQFPSLSFTTLDGSIVTQEAFKGKWSFLTVGPSTCNAQCLDALVTIRQVRRAMAVDRQRIKRFIMLTDEDDLSQFKALVADEQHGLSVLLAAGATQKAFKKVLSPDGEVLDAGLYLIDPLGNLMMYYAPGIEGKKILKDIQRLFKVSKIG